MNAIVPFKYQINCFVKAISLCIDAGLVTPALVNIYSLIDIFSWVSNEENAEDTTRSDFQSWVDNYLLPDSNLKCDSIDLYAARCAILHTGTPRLIRENKAKIISYCWGTAKVEELEQKIQKKEESCLLQKDKYIALHINDLFDALKQAITKYEKYVFENKERFMVFAKRALKTFIREDQ